MDSYKNSVTLKTINLIITYPKDSPFEIQLAAKELKRYINRVSGFEPVITDETCDNADTINLCIDSNVGEKNCDGSATQFFYQSHKIIVDPKVRPLNIRIIGASSQAVLYGAYTFLEELGFGFYLGGDVIPQEEVLVPYIKKVYTPIFSVRGSIPWFNFLNGPTTWDKQDYEYFIGQMVKQKNNFIGFHSYDHEPFTGYEYKGERKAERPAETSAVYGWGCVQPLKTHEFGFGTGQVFQGEIFGSEAVVKNKSDREKIDAHKQILAHAFQYAKARGMKVALGFELSGDPTLIDVQENLQARLKALLKDYPMLDYVWLWQAENLGLGGDFLVRSSVLAGYVETLYKDFAYLEDKKRIIEAVRVYYYTQLAYETIKHLRPDAGVILSGWGGDEWLKFTDFYPGLDKLLPDDIVFSALDNIDPTASSSVSSAYSKLSSAREKWPIPWWESDGAGTRRDQWMPQGNVKAFISLVKDAADKRCSGFLGVHWRTRDLEEVAAFQSQASWNKEITYDEFYKVFSQKCFGPEWTGKMSDILKELESLGPRWTGALGQTECGGFAWFDNNKLPNKTNLQALDRIARELKEIQGKMIEANRVKGLERLEWLLATIEWVVSYDKAALVLWKNGPVAKERKKAAEAYNNNHREAAKKYAQLGLDLLENTGLAEAFWSYAQKMSTQGEWGTLATINVKAYATYMQTKAELEKMGAISKGEKTCGQGALPANLVSDKLFILLRPSLSSYQPIGKDVQVKAVVIGHNPLNRVELCFRSIGMPQWKTVEMKNDFNCTYVGLLPVADGEENGIEYYIKAIDCDDNFATIPKGAPGVVWSTSIGEQYPQISYPQIKAGHLPYWKPELQLKEDVEVPSGGSLNAKALWGGVGLWWEGLSLPAVFGFNVYRQDGNAESSIMLNNNILGTDYFYDDSVKPEGIYTYKVTIVDIQSGKEKGVYAETALKGPQVFSDVSQPVFHAPFGGSLDAITNSGIKSPSKVRNVDISANDDALNLSSGGYLQYPNMDILQPNSDCALECWVNFDHLENLQSLINFGYWGERGWSLESVGGLILRFSMGTNYFHVSGLVPKKWIHVVVSFTSNGEVKNGVQYHLLQGFLNGELVGSMVIDHMPLPFDGGLTIGQYSTIDENLQAYGQIRGVKFYKKALSKEEVQTSYKTSV